MAQGSATAPLKVVACDGGLNATIDGAIGGAIGGASAGGRIAA